MINNNNNEQLNDVIDKKLLETSIRAFEIAINEIRKIENGEIIESPCKKINPDGLEDCAGSTEEAYIDICRYCHKYTQNIKLARLQKQALNALKFDLNKYVTDIYELGYNNGKEKTDCPKVEIEQNIESALNLILEKWQKTQNITLCGSDGE